MMGNNKRKKRKIKQRNPSFRRKRKRRNRKTHFKIKGVKGRGNNRRIKMLTNIGKGIGTKFGKFFFGDYIDGFKYLKKNF